MRRFIGLMSGTSLDAVDAVLVEIDAGTLRAVAFASQPLDAELRSELDALQSSGPDELARAASAANRLADDYAEVVDELLARSGLSADLISAVGAHGQTVRHRPELGYTIQLLNAARLAERCGIPVVTDLRSADIAAGGQGAPLAPAFHAHAFRHPSERRAIVNLGGIANVTLLPPTDALEEPVTGFDTGPANTLLDAWCLRHTGRGFDENGEWARGGTSDPALLSALLADPFFGAPPPKSTGRDRFHLEWLERSLHTRAGQALPASRAPTHEPVPAARDVQATLVELTAVTVARACDEFAPDAVYLCGGGARNGFLAQRLAAHVSPVRVGTTAALGIDPQAVEAAAFAWLAAQRIDRKAGNLPAVTGANGPRVLGSVAEPRLRA